MKMDQSNYELLQKIQKDQLQKILNSPFSEIDPTFLCFSEIYKAVAVNTPKDLMIIDLGCYAGIQSAFFEDFKAYVGVDSCPMAFVGLPEDAQYPSTEDFYMPRLEGDNNHYFVTTIQHFIENMEENGIDPEKCMAIMSYVPDKDAYRKAEKFFPNFACYYPGDHYEKNIFRLHGKETSMRTLIDALQDRQVEVIFDKKKDEWALNEPLTEKRAEVFNEEEYDEREF